MDFSGKGLGAHRAVGKALPLPKVKHISEICHCGLNLMSKKIVLPKIPYIYVHIYESSTYIHMVNFSGKGHVVQRARNEPGIAERGTQLRNLPRRSESDVIKVSLA